MNNILSERLGRLSTSATLAMSQKSSELKAQGIDIINMSVGEPDFNTPDHIKAAGIKAIAPMALAIWLLTGLTTASSSPLTGWIFPQHLPPLKRVRRCPTISPFLTMLPTL